MSPRTTRLIARTWIAASLAGTASCTEYLDRRDAVALGAGNAVATNVATQVIDPWPPHSRDVYADTNGERLQHAIERYRTGQSGSGPSQQTLAAVPLAPPTR